MTGIVQPKTNPITHGEYGLALEGYRDSLTGWFVQASHWGMHPYRTAWDGSWPIKDRAKTEGFEVYREED